MIKKTVGDIVKRARVEFGMSQRGLAAAVSVKGSHIAYIERGMRRRYRCFGGSPILCNSIAANCSIRPIPRRNIWSDTMNPRPRSEPTRGSGSHQIVLC